MSTDLSSAQTVPGTPDRADRVPKYYRVKQRLLRMTEARAPGSPMPAERFLALEFRTSRTTVRKALQELVSEGRLVRIQGKGTFVARPKIYRTLQLTSYTEDMRNQGLTAASRVLNIDHIAADQELAALLEVERGERVLRVERLRLAGGEPMAIEATHLSARRFPGLRRNLARRTSLYATLTEVYGVRLAEADETIETSPATPREAGLLHTDVGLPMLLLSRHSRDERGTPVEWVRAVYRGSRYRFTAILTPPAPRTPSAP
ncbi:GntR family transcriptional regulator [Streptomyces sp. M2CJ-2]|uniref:GntR family transcriptional regulator n=1 Tax=Streptomyces sp. M2CJ-2 TaxID=2803948 RepID=UPI0019258C51|nr:GntR family transcriptional regulator [Streptomyces sp. M2CJ-2]MBL3669262.1 GntR family transcriptional regulator [Streptomyces sp. M2CJ-2]